ncbi:helix-turn-helix domain-containing protein [Alkalibacillus sp. S2W]|uniref:helix-turn-helix domain-containing protein n=1 Tax=Alkalibacillus sp. S2W TaxID=3386553 RepID=UPI00398CA4E9
MKNNLAKFNKLGPLLKELRYQSKLTLRELSNLSGVSYSQISKLEKNRVHPTKTSLLKLAQALNVDVNEFYKYTIHSSPDIMEELNNEVSYEVLTKYNRTCQICGRTAPNTEIVSSLIIPLEEGGKIDVQNAVALCDSCHNGRIAYINEKGIEEDFIYKKYVSNT